MRFGLLILPEARWATVRERWLTAETLGFDHAWTYDHLTWQSFQDETWFGALPTLTAAAVSTKRIRLGTLVASPNFRHPVPFAKELMTLDDISGGRLTVGLGAGTNNFDAVALGGAGWSARERGQRFEEFVTLLDRLLVEQATSAAGEFYTAQEARAIPGCVQEPRIPFAVAAEGPRGMRLAARLAQTWVTVDSRTAPLEQIAHIDAVCEAVERTPRSLARLALVGFSSSPLASLEAFERCAERYREAGFTDLVLHWPRESEPFRGERRVLDEVAQRIADGAFADGPDSGR